MAPILESILRPLFHLEDFIFEKWHKVDFGNLLDKRSLGFQNADALVHATAYEPIWCRNLRNIFSIVRKQNVELVNFIDIGCGRGKPCFYAALKYPFRQIIGVDLSTNLLESAKKNLSYREILLLQTDARSYKIPAGNSLVLLYNPFDRDALEMFLKTNLSHFETHSSFIAYAQDNHRNSLYAFNFRCIYRNESQSLSIYTLSE